MKGGQDGVSEWSVAVFVRMDKRCVMTWALALGTVG